MDSSDVERTIRATSSSTEAVNPLARPPRRRMLECSLGAVLVAACQPKADTIKVRIGYQKNGVLLLARARGGLETALGSLGPVAVEWVEFVAGPPMLEAMRAGAIDIGAVGDTPPIIAQSVGDPIVYAAAAPNADAAEAVIVPAPSPIHGVRDLKGRKIAVTKGSSAHVLLIEALRSVGMTLAEVEPTYLAPPDAASAFSIGAVDAWAIWDPYLAMAQQRGPTRTLINRGGLPPSSAFILAYKPFAQRFPRILASVLDFLSAEAAWGNAHVQEAAQIISDRTGIAKEACLLMLRRAPLELRSLNSFVIARQQAAADTFYAQRLIPAPIDVRAAVWAGWRPAVADRISRWADR